MLAPRQRRVFVGASVGDHASGSGHSYRGSVATVVASLVEEHARDLLRSGDCVLFVGAGLSVPAGYPSGRHLANLLASDLGAQYDGPADDLAAVASAVDVTLGRHHLLTSIANEFDAVTLKPSAVHDRLAAINPSAVITTNWDPLLENAARAAGHNPAVVVTDADLPFNPERQIIKYHGDLVRPETLVITDFDLVQMTAERALLLEHIRTLMLRRATVFIGFSLADWDFRSTYFRCQQALGRLLPRSYAIQLDPPAWLVDVWRQHQIEIIDADAAAFVASL